MMGVLRGFGLALLVGLCACSGGVETEQVEVGFRGMAARNPYLGAQRLAEELGYEGTSTPTLNSMPAADWVLLLSGGVMTGGERQAHDLLRWAGSGGDLWVELGDVDFSDSEDSDDPSNWALYALLEELEVDLVQNAGDGGEGLSLAQGVDNPWPDNEVVLGVSEYSAFEFWGRASHAAMVHLPWGEGSVHLFVSLSGFDNHHLPEDHWAELFEHLMGNSAPGVAAKGIHVVYGGGLGFAALLWRHAWFFLVALGLLTGFWLWRVSRRFGPVLEDPSWDPEGVGIGGGREFVEHIYAAGRTYERRGQLGRLVQAAATQSRNATLGNLTEGSEAGQHEPKLGAATFLEHIQTLQESANRGSRGALVTIEKEENES